MFQSIGYIKLFCILITCVLSISVTNNLNAQLTCADASFGAGNGQQIRVQGAAGLGTFCAPVAVDWYISFDASIPVGADVDVVVAWGDGTESTYNTNNFGTTWELSDGDGVTFTVGSQTYLGTSVARKIYPINEGVCFFDITARLVIDGNVCTASTITNLVNYWDTDEDPPGSVNIEPILIQVCAGDQVTVNFDDNTIFNCVNPGDTDNPNEDLRNVRWTYNTTDGAAPSGRIDNILLGNGQTLDGSNPADRDYIPPPGDVAGSDVNTIEEYPAIVGPGDAVSTTLDITVPATAAIGQVFEVKLENWGPCNPLGGAIPVIERYAIIEIVEPPQGLDFTISTDAAGTNLKTTFCPGEDIRFRGSSTNETADFEYSWQIFDGPNDTDGLVFNRNNDQFTWLSDEVGDLNNAFSTAGDKLVRMFVQNSDIDLTGNCTVFTDKLIEIIETPTPTIGTDDLGGGGTDITISSINLCQSELPVVFVFTDETPDRNASTESRWTIFDNGNNIIFGGGAFAAPTAAADNPAGLAPRLFNNSGHFKLVLEIRDGTTGCEASDTVNIFIYDSPEADFEASTVCAGDVLPDNRTRFFNIANAINGINPQVNGDEIVRWMWDFSFDAGDGFNIERDVNNNNNFRRFLDGTDGATEPTESAPGDYTVALLVETDAGCTNMITYTVSVNYNPESDIAAFYTSDYEGNSAGDPYTGDPICPGTLLTFTNITNEALNDASVNPVDYELQIDSLGITIYRPIGAPGALGVPNESVSPNIFFNNTGSNEIYTIELVANGANGCEVLSTPIVVTVLPGSASGFNVFDEPTYTHAYNALNNYCSPTEFYFQIDNPTDNLLNSNFGDSLVWEVFDGSTLLGGDTTFYGDPDYDKFSFEFLNDYPSIAAINYNIVLQPYVDGVCVNNSQRTVRVLPKPTSEFMPVDTVITCDSVTYYFEAEQPGLLVYDWQVQTVADTLSTQNDGIDFWVSYARPAVGGLAVNVEVRLQTENPFNCQSDLSDPFNDVILPTDDISIILDTIGNEFCTPAVYGFVNNTTDAVPVGTEWQLIITNTDLNNTTIIDGSTLIGNEDFSANAPGAIFEYTFTDSANYEIRLNALLPSTCDVASDPPVSLTIGETPEMQFRTNITEGCAPLDVTIINELSALPSGRNFNLSYEVRNPNGDLVANGGPIVKSSTNPTGFNNLTLPPLENTSAPFLDYEITLLGESFAGCTNDSTVIVRVFQQPEIDFEVTSPSPACEEDYNFEFEVTVNNINSSAYELIWNWGDGQVLITDADTVVNHDFINRASFFGSDSYTVNLSIETEFGCVASASRTINLNPRVQAGFFKDRESGCSPLAVNFSSQSLQAGISGNHVYEKRLAGTTGWEPFNSIPMNNGTVNEVFSNTSDSTQIFEIRYSVSSNIGNGLICSDTALIDSLVVFAEFDSPAIEGTNTVCSFAQQIQYGVDATAGSNYQWTLPLGAFITSQTASGDTITVNFSSFSGNVQVTEIDVNGCFGTPAILPVNVLAGPSGTLSLNGPNVICPGDSTSLLFTLNGPGSQNFDVIYNNGIVNDTLYNVANGHVEPVSPGSSTNFFLIGVIDREFPSCFPSGISGSAFVTVNVKPTATLSGNATICEDNSTNLFFNLSGIGPWEVIYTDGNSNFTINSNSPVTFESVSPTTTTTYSLLSITDNNTPVCSGDVSGTATITINPKPTAEIFGGQDNICANDPTELGINLTGVAPWNVQYTNGSNTFTIPNITPTGAFDPATDTYTHLFNVSPAPGVTNYQLVSVLDSNSPNCSGDISGTAEVIAYNLPTVEISGNATICNGASSPITFNFTGDGPFSGSYAANGDTIPFNNLIDGQSINVSPLSGTVYRVVELFDIRNCNANNLGGPVSINVNNLPTSEISRSDTTCFGQETNLVFDQTGVGPWTITYTNGSQNFTFTTSFNRHFEPVSPTQTTTYTLISVEDSNLPVPCSGTVSGSAQKFVYPQLIANFSATPENMILPERTVSITNTTTNKNEWEYEWNFGDGSISNEVDPGPHEYETFGTYVIRMTATNGQCTDNFQATITIGAIPPIVDFQANPVEGCLPLVVEFENLTQFADPSSYQWAFGDGQRASAVENPTHVYRNPGVYTVTLSAQNITNQRIEVVKTDYITVYQTPEAAFTIPDAFRSVFTGEEVRFVNLSENADEFIWKFGDGNESFEFEPIHAYPDSGIYDITLIAINTETGCVDSVKLSSQVKVILGGNSRVPNAFTPSRAGPGTGSSNPNQNDFFLPRVEGVSQFNMKVYNRWGELLFESFDKTVGWDGYYNGVLMPQGVYVYRLELVFENGRRETKIGDITLIR